MDVDSLIDPITATKSVEPGRGNQKRVDFAGVKTPKACVDVTVQRDDHQVTARRSEESGASRAVCADLGVHGQAGNRLVA